MMRILLTWKHFFEFLLSPNYNDQESGLLKRVLTTVLIFILKFITIVSTGLLIGALSGTVKPGVLNETLLHTSLVVAIFAGFFEELVFRLPLTKFNQLYLSLSLTGLIFIVIKKVYFSTMLLENEGMLLSVIISVLTFPVFYFITKKYKENLAGFWEKHFAYVFYISALIFALSHFFSAKELELTNLRLNITHFISALFLGFLRIRTGLMFAILVHLIWDLML